MGPRTGKWSFAQTNLQLYNQLVESGYSESELGLVRKAYEFAIITCTGRFRENGKVFLAHLIGTASILAHLQERGEIVVAGLLHSIYLRGEFGDGSLGVDAHKRDEVRAVVGEAVEKIIAHFSPLTLGPEKSRWWRENPEALRSEDRLCLLLGLVNVLEHYLDNGAHYCNEAKPSARSERINEWRRLGIETSERLGYPLLAQMFEEVLGSSQLSKPPAILKSPRMKAFTLAPLAYRLRTRIKIKKWIQGAFEKVFNRRPSHPKQVLRVK